MDALDAIRHRRSVRQYTDRPVDDRDLDRLLRLALLAPTGGNAQAWSLLVVRDADLRRQVAELIVQGGAEYFFLVRPRREGATDEEHRAWARQFAGQVLGSYGNVPVWIVGLAVPRHAFPPGHETMERRGDELSVAFAFENLFVAARAMGLGTVPTIFHWFVEDRIRALLAIPEEMTIPLVTPLGYPVAFPEGLPPAIAANRRPWRTLVHDERWGNPRT